MSIMKRKKQLLLMSLAALLVIGFGYGIYLIVPQLLAGDTQVTDLTLKSQVNDQTIQLTVSDQNQTDTKVVVPLTDKLSYTPTKQANAGVTYDEVNHQIVIDWLTNHPKMVNLTVKAAQAGTYVFKAQTTRNDTPVNTTPIAATIKPVENTSTSSVLSDNQTSLSEKIAVPGLQEPDTTSSQSLNTEQATPLQKRTTRDLPTHADTDIVTTADFDNQPWIIYTLNKEWNMDISNGKITFGMLKKVTMLDLWSGKNNSQTNNYATGYIPAGIKYLTNLKILGLGKSTKAEVSEDLNPEVHVANGYTRPGHISGSIPPEIGQLKELEIFSVGAENITGTIPAEINQLTKLKHIDINGYKKLSFNLNSISGLTNLTSLCLYNMKKTDGALSDIINLDKLKYIELRKDNIKGKIPSEIANIKFDYLNLTLNQLEGTLPESFNNLDSNASINLSENPDIYGVISEKVAGLNPTRSGETNLGYTQLTIKDPKKMNNSAIIPFTFMNGPSRSLLRSFAKENLDGSYANTSVTITDSSNTSKIQVFDSYGANITDPLNIGIGSGSIQKTSEGRYIKLSSGHTFQISDSKGNLIYDGPADPNLRLTPKSNETKYVILVDHTEPNPDIGITELDLNIKWIRPKTTEDLKSEDPNLGTDNHIKYVKQKPFEMISSVQNDDTFTISMDKTALTVKPAEKDKVDIDKTSFEIQKPNTTIWESVSSADISDIENGYQVKLNGLALKPKEKVKIRYSVTAKEALDDTGVLSSETSLMSGYKLPVASADMTIKNGQLLFKTVPTTMSFADSKIANLTTEIKRKLPDWKMQIEDSRVNKTDWHITANLISELQNSNGDSLGDSVVFKKTGQPNQVINTTSAVDVYDSKAGTTDYQDVQWGADAGPTLSVAPGLAKLGSYTGTMQWTLVDAPA